MAGRKYIDSTGVAADLSPLDGTEIVRMIGDPAGTPHSGRATTDDIATLALAKVLNEGVTGPAGPAGADGAPGADGADGADGVDGASLHSGNGPPSPALGNNGDGYLDNLTGDTYQKAAGTWSADGGNLMGPQGPAGAAGADGADGAQGPEGPQGPQGVQGVPGADGADGADGSQGPAGTSIHTGTGAPSPALGNNDDKYVDTVTGDLYLKAAGSWSVIGNLLGPAGAQGDAGPQGPQGDPGADGADGATGPAGVSIFSGTGAPGAGLGNNGDKYVDEATGDFYAKATGVWAVTGSLLGPAGPQGAQGPQGIQGVQGDPGADGANGADGADGVDGFNFHQGTGVPSPALGNNGDSYTDNATGDLYEKAGGTWSASGLNLLGPQGPAGPQGDAGPQGLQGIQGPAGADGADGATGPAGPQGDAGPQGIQGIQGPAGADGSDGAPGADGTSFISGAGAPSAGLGNDGDRYLNETTGDLYAKATGTWTATGENLTGPQGPQGVQGDQGLQGIQGIQGPAGADGADGANGVGLPAGGDAGQVAAKNSATDYDVAWINPPATATESAEGLAELSTAAEYRSKAAGAKTLTPTNVWDAAAEVTLTDAATVALDLSSGLDFAVTINGARTLGNPTNAKPGQKGRLRVVQGAGGGHSLAPAANYIGHGGEALTFSTAAGAEDFFYYDVVSPTKILLLPAALAAAAF